MRQMILRSAAVGLLMAVWCSVPAGQARGQFNPGGGQVEPQNVFRPAPRQLRQYLTRAEKALADGEFSDAVLQLGALLTTTRSDDGEEFSQDYFVEGAAGSKPSSSLKAEALRLLGTMPARGRELYELQYGADARALLDDAVAEGRIEALNEVTRRYFHTKAGHEAAMLLGRLHLDQGRPLAAALSFQRVAETPAAARQFDPELSVLLASSWLYANMPDKARQVLLGLKQRLPEATLRVGSQQVRLFQKDAEALAWLDNLIGLQRGVQGEDQLQWTLFRGTPQRNASSRGSMPLLNFRWRVPTVNDPADERLVAERSQDYLNKDLAALPVLAPLAVDGIILMRTPSRLVAVDFQSGKRVWEFPWLGSNGEQTGEALRLQGGANSPRMNELNQRIWEDAAYGQVSSDGESVFLLNDLGYANANAYTSPFVVVPGGNRQPNPNWPKKHNELVALDLEKEGKLRWIVGSTDGRDEPALAGAFFLGPPLPLMRELFVLAEVNGEIRLVVLDSRTGRLQWSQQLAHVDQRTIENNGERRLAGATPSFADGVLICPTSAGAVVAVNVANRSLLWGTAYKQTSNRSTRQFGFSRAYLTPPRPVGQRWVDATAVIAEGRVLITPVESDELYCLDLVSGELLWQQPREDGLYLACVHEQRVVVVGKSSVRCFGLADGKPAWSKPISLADQLPSGRGFLSDGLYYLPTSKSQLLKLDVAAGVVKAEVRTNQPLGNLVCYRDEVISQGSDWLATYYQSDPLRQEVAQRLKQSPDDAWALSRQGEILLQDGDRQEALRVLRLAYRVKPGDVATRGLLVQTLLDALQQDFASNRNLASELESLIDQPEQRSHYLRLMASGLQQVGEIDEAFAVYLKLAEPLPGTGESLRASRPELEEIDGRLRVRRDRWIQARLLELLEAANDEQRARMNAIIQQRYEQTLEAGSPQALRNFLNYFSQHPLATDARLRLAARLIELQEYLEAELLLALAIQDAAASDTAQGAPAQGADAAALNPTVARAHALQARLLQNAGRVAAAARQFQLLRDRYAQFECLDGKTGQELFAEAEQDEALAEELREDGVWPAGRAEVDDGGRMLNRYSSYPRIYPVAREDAIGPFRTDMRVVYDQRRNTLEVLDRFGNPVREVPLGEGRRIYFSSTGYSGNKFHTNGHLVLGFIGHEVVCFNLLDASENSSDAILWRQDLVQTLSQSYRTLQVRPPRSRTTPWGDSLFTAVDSGGNPIGMISSAFASGIYYLKSRELVCVDPLSGETIWSRNGMPPGAELFGDDEYVFVVAPNANEALVYSARDGRELGRRDVAPSAQRWNTLGRHELSWTQTGDGLRLQLRDAWSGDEIWNRQVAAGSRGSLIGQDEVAVVEPNGKFVVMSLSDARPRLEGQLQAESNLTSVQVLRSSEQYLLIVNTPPTGNSTVNAQPIRSDPTMPLVHGKVYAFDRQSGQSVWQAPAVIDRYGLPLDQPLETPALVFLRHVTATTAVPGRRPGTRGSVLCLDRRDGRILLQDDNVPGTIHSYQIAADRKANRVQLLLPGKTYSITFTDQPTPPQPPAQTGQLTPQADGLAGAQSIRGFAGALFGAFRNAARGNAENPQPGKENGPAAEQAEKPAAEKPAAEKPKEKQPEQREKSAPAEPPPPSAPRP